jgi:peptidyl-prolyl cis-trans isomerase B (cyclophilin B)
MNIKTTILVLVIAAAVLGAFYFMRDKNEPAQISQEYNQDPQTMTDTQNTQEPQTPAPVETATAKVETSEGTFEITLDGKAAPKTVENFIKLSKQGFYSNLTFHRIVQDFVIQGGDPKGDGTGGPGYTVPAEIGLKHTAGAIAMARTGDEVNPTRASSGSQFYIALQALAGLDGQYTVFGYVTKGMDVVEKIGRTPTEPNPFTGEASTPLKPVTIKSITIVE